MDKIVDRRNKQMVQAFEPPFTPSPTNSLVMRPTAMVGMIREHFLNLGSDI